MFSLKNNFSSIQWRYIFLPVTEMASQNQYNLIYSPSQQEKSCIPELQAAAVIMPAVLEAAVISDSSFSAISCKNSYGCEPIYISY